MTRRESGEVAAGGGGGGGGDSGDPGIQLEGPGERTETSSWSPKDVPPRCLVQPGEDGGAAGSGGVGLESEGTAAWRGRGGKHGGSAVEGAAGSGGGGVARLAAGGLEES